MEHRLHFASGTVRKQPRPGRKKAMAPGGSRAEGNASPRHQPPVLGRKEVQPITNSGGGQLAVDTMRKDQGKQEPRTGRARVAGDRKCRRNIEHHVAGRVGRGERYQREPTAEVSGAKRPLQEKRGRGERPRGGRPHINVSTAKVAKANSRRVCSCSGSFSFVAGVVRAKRPIFASRRLSKRHVRNVAEGLSGELVGYGASTTPAAARPGK